MHFTNYKAQTNALNGCLATKFEKVEPNSVLHVACNHRLMLEKDDALLVTTSQSQGQGQKSKAKTKAKATKLKAKAKNMA